MLETFLDTIFWVPITFKRYQSTPGCGSVREHNNYLTRNEANIYLAVIKLSGE